jgi:hypothetical protein
MKIEKVYKTSKGTFWSEAQAEKNRAKVHSGVSYEWHPEYFKADLVDEPVLESFVLVADVRRTSGLGIETVVFELSTVEVK